jgi:hypothetical protein
MSAWASSGLMHSNIIGAERKAASRRSFIPSYLYSRLCSCFLSLPAPAEQT